MRSTICKTFQFHAAHVIPHHRGKCSRPHGHTYRVDVEVSGEVQSEGPEAGMVTDFDRIKQVWSDDLEPILDHQNINETLVDTGHIPHSTAEHLAGWILAVMNGGLAGTVTAVRVWETPTSYAEAGWQ